ncbi:ABC transporter permease subunit [Clostridium sp. D53t1_180928_C8]|uniref:ABC transporter permease subunit n=1 Tax=Clostridium sp. D53t1_180928_C8 TaxID=2787101 RepID=UPI001FABBACD|nr:ABC transporter permease subunit [Clostridium sp. D53t1_180928_C8]
MMKIFRLTYNELVKQFKKPSIKIIFALILISAMILPAVINKIPQNYQYSNALESNKYMLQQAEQNVEEFSKDKTEKGKIQLKYAIIEKECMQLFVDYEIGFDDWRKNEVEAYRNAAYELAAIEFVLNGYNQEVIIEKLQCVDPNKIQEYNKMTLEKKKEVEAKYTALKQRALDIIANNDNLAHTEDEIKRKNEYIALNQKYIDEYEKLKAKNPTKKEDIEKLEALEKEAINAAESIKYFNIDNAIMQFRLDNKINYDSSNWKNNSIKTVEEEVSELRMKLLTEKEYAASANQLEYSMTYDEYVKNYNETNNKRVNKIKEVWYGLENNIPDLNDIRDARSVLDSTYEIYIILAVIMVIIIGGGIVATEFSKGTIRLLLIRPVSRWKILLSKLLAVLIVGFSIVILGIGILYVSTGVVFGMDTYNTPLLETVGINIEQVSFMSYLIPKILLSCSSLVFIISLVFAVSTLAKNTALAVAISMVLYLGIAPATDLLISMKQTWIVNTLLPYINSSYLRLMPSGQQMLSESFGMSMNFESGAVQLLIVSAVLLIGTFIVFIKKDVKS